MRIISKFRDYYDSIQAHGVDMSLVFQRKTKRYFIEEDGRPRLADLYSRMQGEEFEGAVSTSTPGIEPFWLNKDRVMPWRRDMEGDVDGFVYKIREVVVGFCGVIRPAIKVIYGKKDYTGHLSETSTKREFAYTLEDLDKIVSYFPKGLQNKYYGKKKSKKERRRKPDPHGVVYGLDRADFEQFFKVHQPVKDDRLFQHFGAPILVLRKIDGYSSTVALHTNDELTKVDYMKVVDPYMAYQEIAMYISGVLGVGEPDTLDISDEDMRDEKGFFDMSFKTDPGTKKPRKRGKK